MTYCRCTECDKKKGECKCERPSFMEFLDKKDHIEIESKSKQKEVIKVKGWIGTCYVESVVVDGKPCFLCNYNNKIHLASTIPYEGIIYKPIEPEECGYFPYRFSKSEIELLTNNPEEITKEKLLDKLREKTDFYVDIFEIGKNLVTGDLLLSYCQEWIDTLHFPFIVGETESGKSTILYLFKWLGYRTLLGEGIPFANLYRFLGKDEEATGTICEDEAQDLYKNYDKIKLYKSSYARGSLQPRIVGSDNNLHQVFFKTFCLKLFAGEKIPEDKGFKERLAIVHMTEGIPKGNIKRLTDEEKTSLQSLRNQLLFWKVLNINSGIDRHESGLQKRDQELWEDFLSVVSGTKYFERGRQVADYFILQRHQVIWNSIESKLLKLIIDKLDENCSIILQSFWEWLTTEGQQDELTGYKEKESYYLYDFGRKITRNSISKTFEEKFQAKKVISCINNEGRKQQVTQYIFDKEICQKLATKYNVKVPLDSILLRGGSGLSGRLADDVDHLDHYTGETNEL